MCFLHDEIKVEAKDLLEEVHGLSERNMQLVDDLSKSLCCQEALKKVNLHVKVDDAIYHCLGLIQEMEEKTQQFESLKLQYTEKVSQLEIACSGKDLSIKFLEEELLKLKTIVSKKYTKITSLGKLQTSSKHDVLQYQMISE